MAKLSVKNREKYRRQEGREVQDEACRAPRGDQQRQGDSDEDREAARAKLQQAAARRVALRVCATAARSPAARAAFTASSASAASKLRELALRGEVPGIIKASW